MCTDGGERLFGIYDLFEGTEQIQQLVISRAIFGRFPVAAEALAAIERLTRMSV